MIKLILTFLTSLIIWSFSHFLFAQESLLVMHTKEGLVNAMEHTEDLGPIVYAHKLLFDEIGIPERFTYFPYARSQKVIDEKTPACLLFKRKNLKREAKYLFSNPIAFSMGQRLYQHTDSPAISQQYFNKQGQLKSVSALLNDRPKEHILYLPNFSYGEALDAQLAQISEHQKIKTYIGDLHLSQSAMFFKKRADFALMISSEVRVYFEERAPIEYLSYPIANATVPITVHIMCNITEQSKNWLQIVDEGLEKIYQSPSYRDIYTNLYDADDVSAIYALIDQY